MTAVRVANYSFQPIMYSVTAINHPISCLDMFCLCNHSTIVYSSPHSFHQNYIFFVIRVYNLQIAAPQEGCTQVEKAEMWKSLLY
ncbi:hypothetical protein EB796_015320 [Bugula neritina]|uniref:Uncharacterized protein n=1 Tax=Bugula neritina TaxID=10212 RepID=A0A7J7JJ65_BUGNE|nr:hypothetical protein EB796_015320 [Bugula neritina]